MEVRNNWTNSADIYDADGQKDTPCHVNVVDGFLDAVIEESMLNTIGLTALIAVLALSIWSCAHSWRLRSKFLKWGGVAVAAVLAVGLSSVSALTMVGMVKQHARKAPVPDLTVEASPRELHAAKRSLTAFAAHAIQKPAP